MRTVDTTNVAAPAAAPDGTDESVYASIPSIGASVTTLSTEAFLAIIGRRVRSRRASLRMTRRSLAAGSGVSERYLAQLESGQGNMSIALLRKVASALALPLPELVAESDADLAGEAFVAAAADASGVPPSPGRYPLES